MIEGCVRNEQKHQNKFFKLCYNKMITIALQFTCDRDSAEEIVQESFIKLFNNLQKYKESGSFNSWVGSITRNTAIDIIRKSNKSKTIIIDDFSNFNDVMMDDIEIECDIELKSKEILALANKLSPTYQNVFKLYVLDGFSHREISDKLSINIGTSKSNLFKAKRNIREMYERS